MSPQTLERPQTGTAKAITNTDLRMGTMLMLSNAEHIRARVVGHDEYAVALGLLENQLIDGKAELVIPIHELTDRGWRLMPDHVTPEPKAAMQIDPSEIRPGAILSSPMNGILCRVDSVEHGQAKLSVLDNNTINGDKEILVVINRDLLTTWQLFKPAA